MTISYSKNFIKQSKRLPSHLRRQVIQKIERFSVNPFDPLLRNHRLKGSYRDYGSINITGDYRALYLVRGDEIIFDLIGTHAQLYE